MDFAENPTRRLHIKIGILAFRVVIVVLSIISLSRATDVLQCTGRRQDDGLVYFNASYEVKENIRDCETQWLVDEKVAGHSDANGDLKFMLPIIKATANTAIFQTCPEKLECLLICPTSNINERQQCSCDATTPTTLPEVGFPNWSSVLIGAIAFAVLVLVSVLVTVIVVRRKSQTQGYSCGSTSADL